MSATTSLNWDGEAAEEAARAGAVRGLALAAEHLLAESRAVVPKEETTLERSGVASVDAGELTAAVSYDTPYAARQHEELTWRHQPPQIAKYLEIPLGEEAETIKAKVAAEIRRALRS